MNKDLLVSRNISKLRQNPRIGIWDIWQFIGKQKSSYISSFSHAIWRNWRYKNIDVTGDTKILTKKNHAINSQRTYSIFIILFCLFLLPPTIMNKFVASITKGKVCLFVLNCHINALKKFVKSKGLQALRVYNCIPQLWR